MTTKEASVAIAQIVAAMQDRVAEIATAMASAETMQELNDQRRQADQLRSAIESMQRAQLILTPMARESELNAEARAQAAERLAAK